MNKTIRLLLAPAALSAALCADGASPVISRMPQGVCISRLSDNGRWGLSQNGGETEDGQLFSAGGSYWDITTMKSVSVALPSSGRAGVNDITDDGTLIVGSANDLPATYNTSTKEWTTLPLPAGATAGGLLVVTPDGSRAAGFANISTDWDAVPVLYDLKEGKLIELPNLPTLNMNHEVAEINRFCDISADGRYVVGRLSEEILLPVSMCAYVYDTQTNNVKFIGFTPDDSRPWTPDYKHLYFIDNAIMSPNGKHITGNSYIVHEIDGQEYPEEYNTAYIYDVDSQTFTAFDGAYDSDVSGFAVSDSGTVLVSVPAVNPYASMAVRVGNYYYTLEEIFSQAYGIDYSALTGNTNTGKPIAASADCMTLSMLVGPDEGYILKMSEEWSEAAARVNLLNAYTASPASGSVFSSLSNIKLTFARNIDLSGAANRIKLLDADGKTVASALAAETSGQNLSVRFRPTALEAGKTYKVSIPEGFVTMSGDAMVAAGNIELQYTGRRAGAIAAEQILPADGSTFSRLDASTNCIFITFDASVAVADGAKAELHRKGESTVLTDLSLSLYSPNTVILYPAARQYLYDGSDYTVVLPAGSITDLSGEGANERIELNYSGNYIREVSAGDKYLFSDDCDNYTGFMYYDGDRLAPGSVPASWGFTADIPWALVRDDNTSTDMAMAAHSMFAEGGKADDWAVIPQLYIPDAQCYLSFDAQSYRKDKADRLKVYAYVSENGYSTLTADIVNRMRTEGELIFDEQLLPGESEETTEGEWTTYTVKLPQFAQKNVYLAFVNDNENQSAVFINHVEVVHDMQFLTSVTSRGAVVGANETTIEGVLTFISDILQVNTIDIELNAADGTRISAISASGLNLSKGNTFPFTFDRPLPLKQGVNNRFSLTITINGSETTTVNSGVKNLVFEPERKVVIEEYSGSNCSNCPLGFAAMSNLEKLYPGKIIPIVLRTYESDPLGTGMSAYTTFLGLDAMGAPSGVVNRSVACYPMASVGNDYRFSGEGTAEDGGNAILWLDAVASLMQEYPDADVDFSAEYDGATGDITIDGNVRFALNASRNVNLFTVVLEDKCATTQLNGMRYFSDPDLGEWGNGGLYAQREVAIDIDNVGRAAFGSTFNGTPGLVPTVQTAGTDNAFNYSVRMPDTVDKPENTRLVIMMIDSDTDAVINANVKPIAVSNSAISEVETDATDSPAEYFDLQGRKVLNPSSGRLLIKRQGASVSKIIF